MNSSNSKKYFQKISHTGFRPPIVSSHIKTHITPLYPDIISKNTKNSGEYQKFRDYKYKIQM